jgi:hypothetical protein
MARKSEFYSPEINTVLTRNLILAILRGDLKNESDVAKWIDGVPQFRNADRPLDGARLTPRLKPVFKRRK